jgi:hypothetical protein
MVQEALHMETSLLHGAYATEETTVEGGSAVEVELRISELPEPDHTGGEE